MANLQTYDDIDLMQYLDGELSEDEGEAVRAQVEANPADQRKLQALGQVRDTVATFVEIGAEIGADGSEIRLEARFDTMWRAIEGTIRGGEISSSQVAASAAAAAPAVPETRAVQETSHGFLHAIRQWFHDVFEDKRGYVLTSAVTAGAVAALILVFRPPTERIIEREGPERIVRIVDGADSTGAQNSAAVVPVASQPTAVEELTVNGGTGYILTIPGDDNGENETTVIWIESDDNNTVEGPI